MWGSKDRQGSRDFGSRDQCRDSKDCQGRDSRDQTTKSLEVNQGLQSEVLGETIPEFVAFHNLRGQAQMYAEHDALMRTEKHIWKYNKFPEKNRNPASVCYNEGAVELVAPSNNKKEEKLDRGQTYINANHLKSIYGNFILAQAPMANTLIEWYRMIWQLKIAIIVCLVDPENTTVCERYFKTTEGSTLKIKNRFQIRTVSVREEDGGIVNYELRLSNKLSMEKHRTLYVIAMPTKLDDPVEPRRQLKLVAEVWATEMATTCLADDVEPPPILVHGCNGVSRTSAFVATSMLCKSLRTTGEMSPVEVWTRLNCARHNAAKERIHFLSSIECALLYAVDNGLLQANNPHLANVNKMIQNAYENDRKKTRHPSASRE